MKNCIITLAFFLSSLSALFSQVQLSDSAKISLITTSPWSGAIYAVYGHTAMYVKDDSTGIDKVYNYGYFDDSKPNFMYNFVRGATDYSLGDPPFDYFIREYIERGLEVIEQELNLTQTEKQNLFEALYTNALPQNREYRYNFLLDNCSTRPRDMVEKYVDGKIVYPAENKKQTFRDLIHECVHPYPWMEFGIDLIIGSGADTTITNRDKMFLPIYLMNAFDGATILKNDTLQYSLVKSTNYLLQSKNKTVDNHGNSLFSSLIVAFAILLIAILVSLLQVAKRNQTVLPRIFDTILFGTAGLGGIVIFFLMFFSVHPVVNANWNFIWLNILSLIFAVLFWVKSLQNIVHVYHFINFVVLLLFVLLWWLIPQNMPLASIPIALSLCLRSAVNVWMRRNRKLHNRRFPSSRYMKAGWGQYNS